MSQATKTIASQLQPVGNITWGKTTRELRGIHLGVLDYHHVLFCIICPYTPRAVILTISGAVEHAAGHRRGKRTPTKEEIRAIIQKHVVFTGELKDIPTPTHPARPFPFLETEEALRCEHGDDEPCNAIVRESAKNDHFRNSHSKYNGYRRFSGISVQTFSQPPHSAPRNDFEVAPYNGEPADPHNFPILQGEVDSELMSVALRASWYPLPAEVGTTEDGYRTTSPFLARTGLASFVKEWDLAHFNLMTSLIQRPKDKYRQVVEQAESIFKKQQQTLNDELTSFRLVVMADDQNPHAFSRCDSTDGQDEYGECWGLFILFIIRLAQREFNKESIFGIHLSVEQLDYARYIISQIEDSVAYDWNFLFLELCRWTWHAEGENDFQHLIKNKWSDPTLVFCALRALRSHGGFYDPAECGHKWAPVKYMIRNSLYQYWTQGIVENTYTVEVAMLNLKRGLVREQLYPFSSVADFSSLAATYANTTTKPPAAIWRSNTCIVVSGSVVDIKLWRSGVRQYANDTFEHFDKKVFLEFSIGALGLELTEETLIHDDLECYRPGYSFLNDPRNTDIQANRFALGDAIFRFPNGSGMHNGVVNQHVNWNEAGADQWLHDLSVGSTHLCILVHLCCGLPPRGPEEGSWTISNSVGRPRSFIIVGPGQVGFLGMYSKTSRMTGFDKPRVHALPWVIARVFLAMHIVAIPLSSILLEREAGVDARVIQEKLAFPIRGKGLDSKAISKGITTTFVKYVLAEDMGLQNYRQFADAIAERYLPSLKEVTKSVTTHAHAQGAHTSNTSGLHYGTAVERTYIITPIDFLRYYEISLGWASFIFPISVFTKAEKDAIVGAKGLPPTSTTPLSNHTMQGQTDPYIQFAQNIDYARLAKHMHKLQIKEAINVEAPVSHTSQQTNLSMPNPNSQAVIVTPAQLERSTAPIILAKHKSILRTFVGNKHAQWTCPGQAHAFVLATQHNRRSVLAILPTGAGKSMLFMGMPLMEKGVIPVIVPLAALLEDHLRTAQRMRVKACKWDSNDIPLDPEDGLVFIPVELVDRRFQKWCLALRAKQRLTRIVFDEGHLVLEAANYRNAMESMNQLIETAVPLLILTATVPPALEKPLLIAFGSPTIDIVREGTQRPNIALHLARYTNRDSAVAALLNHVQLTLDKIKQGEGILVCVRTEKDVTDLLARIPRSKGWYSRLPENEKLGNAEGWLKGKFQVLVSTSGMGTGTHHPCCRAVFHLSLPWGTQSYHQQSGRCGRDGKPALSVMFHWGSDMPPQLEEFNGWEIMKALAQGSTRCIRLTLSEYLDGPGLRVTCYAAGDYLECGNCLAQKSTPVATKQTIWRPENTVALLSSIEVLEEDMDIDPAPLTLQQRQQEQHQARQEAALYATQPEPMDLGVENDADRATKRRIDELTAVLKAASEGEMNIALLVKVMEWMDNRCTYCLVHHFHRSAGHTLERCLVNRGLDGHLDGYTVNSQKLTYSRTCAQLPVDHSVCFTCHWFDNKTGLHPGPKSACSQTNQVLQLVWLLRLEEDIWPAMSQFFGLDEGLGGPGLIKWAYTTYGKEKYNKRSISMVNEWRAVMWYICRYRGKDSL